jgi:hypothetical protein
MYMRNITIEIVYPEDKEQELLLPMAVRLGHKTGDLHAFMQEKAQAHMTVWFRGLMATPQKPVDKGFGDTLARWIRYIAKPFVWLSMNCGCDKRRKWLNKTFPYAK